MGGIHVRENKVEKGCVVQGQALTDLFIQQGLKPDFESKSSLKDSKIVYTHRVANKADIYFVSNQRRQFDFPVCTFRVSGKKPELWHADTGLLGPVYLRTARVCPVK